MLEPALESAIRARIAAIPIVDTMQMAIEELSQGRCRMRVPRKKSYDGVYESFHGGLLMTSADSAACFAILTITGAEEKLTTTDMSIRFLAPCLSDLIVEAKCIKVGRTLCPVAIDLFDEHGKLVAVASVNYIRLA
ncbi:MAG: PaaI family thioesterase [Desulfarculaceae bacterium]|nr:PaaI family thioesterase [Desulfarculaceae bacterium]MCF8072293.1 PaaI family thioesterase [Desulfarculaceae bacterium]MCF8100214.1 PaaI family thioesterase [Desulfarculaceae bacterium]MCF8116213.1 PaaI family thioesterase [Desulfarculaceae bacterium]